MFCLPITEIYPQASSKEGANGSQSDNSRNPCAVVFTSLLTSRLYSQLQELQELPTSPVRMWSSSKRASASIYLGSRTRSWTRVQGARSWCSTTELSTHPFPLSIFIFFFCVLISKLISHENYILFCPNRKAELRLFLDCTAVNICRNGLFAR